MSSRHRAREIALQILYQNDIRNKQTPIEPAELQDHFKHFQVSEDLREFVAELVIGTSRSLEKTDEAIEKHAANWTVSRMSHIDRSILRMAVFEMDQFKDIPDPVTINEAVELAKEFGSEESPSFINGILDAIRQAKLADPLR